MHNPRHPKKSHSVSLCINKPFLVRFCVITAFFDRDALWGSCSTPYIPQHTSCSTLYQLNVVLNSGQPPFHVRGTESARFRHEIGEFEQNGSSCASPNLTKYGCLYKAKRGGIFLRVSRVMHLAVISHCENNHQCYHVYR